MQEYSARMEVGEVIDAWDDVETDPESSDISSEGRDAAAQEVESESNDDIADGPSTSAGSSSTASSMQQSPPAGAQQHSCNRE